MLTAWIVGGVFCGLWTVLANVRARTTVAECVMGFTIMLIAWPLIIGLLLVCSIPMIIWGIVGD